MNRGKSRGIGLTVNTVLLVPPGLSRILRVEYEHVCVRLCVSVGFSVSRV